MDDVFEPTPSSPESVDVQKSPGGDVTVHVKLLIPSGAAGAIIGKDGKAITNIQHQSDTKVKVSKQNEFFPGTTERVCLVSGPLPGVLQVHQHIARQICDKKDLVNGALPGVDRTRQVKVLVPNSTAGMIIGKGGSFIRQLQQNSGATIQISQRVATPLPTAERCVTITGEAESCQRALETVIGKLADDPQAINSATFSSVFYNGGGGGGGGGNGVGLADARTHASLSAALSAAVSQGGCGGARSGPSVMPLLSPASMTNFMLPAALWNQNLLPFVLPRTLATEGHAVTAGDYGQASTHLLGPGGAASVSGSFPHHQHHHPHSTALLHLASNGNNTSTSHQHHHQHHQQHQHQQHHHMSSTASLIGAAPSGSHAAASGGLALAAAGGANSLISSQFQQAFWNAAAAAAAAAATTASPSMVEGASACAMKELQVAECFVGVLLEQMATVQRECGVSIQLHAAHSKPMGSQLPMKLGGGSVASPSDRWRLVSVFGTPSALFRAVDRIQALLQHQQQQKALATSAAPSAAAGPAPSVVSAFHLVSAAAAGGGGGILGKTVAAAKPIPANL